MSNITLYRLCSYSDSEDWKLPLPMDTSSPLKKEQSTTSIDSITPSLCYDFESSPEYIQPHMPFYPTPPYENPDEWSPLPMDSDTTSGRSSISDDPVGLAGYTPPEEISELTSVNFSNINSHHIDETELTLDANMCNENLATDSKSLSDVEESTIDRLLQELDNSDIPGINNTKIEVPQIQDITESKELSVSENSIATQKVVLSNTKEVNSDSENSSTSSVAISESENSEDENDIIKGNNNQYKVVYNSNTSQATLKRRYSTRSACGSGTTSNDEPAIKMIKVSPFDQFRRRREEPAPPRHTPVSITKAGKKPKEDESILSDVLNVDPGRKAAVQAKINREKKKAYIADLESERDLLKNENSILSVSSSRLQKQCNSLTEEVAYLKSVLANQSSLAGLLKNIGNTEGVSLRTSFVSGRDRAHNTDRFETDHDYNTNLANSMSGGVCLHVDKNNVSLEFCSSCARRA